MGTSKKCDRCKTLYEEQYTPDLKLINYIHPYGDQRIDLCPNCLSELRKWAALESRKSILERAKPII